MVVVKDFITRQVLPIHKQHHQPHPSIKPIYSRKKNISSSTANMKSTVFSAATLLSLASTGLTQYTEQSKPFSLLLKSSNETLNGKALAACHEGAAIEGLCTIAAGKPTDYNTYRFNTSSSAIVSDKTLGPTGYLTYELIASNANGKAPLICPHAIVRNPELIAMSRVGANGVLLRALYQRCLATLRALRRWPTSWLRFEQPHARSDVPRRHQEPTNEHTSTCLVPLVRLQDELRGLRLRDSFLAHGQRHAREPNLPEGRCRQEV